MNKGSAFFEALVDKVGGGIVVATMDRKITYVNKSFSDMLLYDNPSEIIGKDVAEITHENDLALTSELINKGVKTKKIDAQLEKTYIKRNGELLSALVNARVQMIDGCHYLTAFVTDFSQQQQSRKILDQQYKRIIETADDIIFTVDVNGNFLYVNEYAQKLVGKNSDELLNSNFLSLVTPSYREEVRAYFRKHFLSKKDRAYYVFPISGQGEKVYWIGQNLTTIWDLDKKRITGYSAVARNVTNEYEAKEALSESQKRYAALFNDSTIPLWLEDFSLIKNRIDQLKEQGVVDFESYFIDHPEEVDNCISLVKIIEINKEAVQLHKAGSKAELIEGLYKIFTTQSWQVFKAQLVSISSGVINQEFESRVKTLDGETRYVNVKWMAMEGCEATLEKVFVSTVDVTESVLAKEKLIENEERLSTLFNSVKVPIIVINPDTCEIEEANDAFVKNLGYSKLDLHTLLASDIDGKHDFAYVQKSLQRSLSESVVKGHTLWKRADGSLMEVDLTNTLIKYNGKERVLTSGIDVTEVKKLNAENERFRTIMNEAPFAIYIVDIKGHIIDVNKTASDQLGYSREELLSLAVKDVEVPDKKPENASANAIGFEQVTADELNLTVETNHKRKDGTVFPVSVTITGRKLNDIDVIVASVFDNTILKKQREELLTVQNDLFVSNGTLVEEIELRKKIQLNLISSEERERKRIARELHDGLGQKLTAAKYSLGALKRRTDLKEADQQILAESINVIEESMREVREISHNLMPTLLTDFGLEIALAKMCKRIDLFNQMSVSFIAEGTLKDLPAHIEVALYRVAQEAISNAAKYSKASLISVRLKKDKGQVKMVIEDDGVGFSYKQRKNTDGIGLKNIEERCVMIKAECKISSKLGKGTRIEVKYNLIEDGENKSFVS